MKTLKLLLVAVLLSVSAVGFATDDKKSSNNTDDVQPVPAKAVKISLGQAILNPFLVQQMHLQIEEQNMLQDPSALYIVAYVFHGNTHYYIYGSYEEWRRFFLNDGSSARAIDSNLE